MFKRRILKALHHPSPAGQISRRTVSGVFSCWGGTVERGNTVGCLSLSCRRLASGLPSLHFLVNRLHSNRSTTWLSTVDYYPLSPRHLGEAASARLMFRNKRRAVDGDAETNVFPLISRIVRIDFRRHTGESHFLLGLIQHFNLLQLSSTKSKSNRFLYNK